jgi:hypothetical protein
MTESNRFPALLVYDRNESLLAVSGEYGQKAKESR